MGAQVGAALRARVMAAPGSPAGSALQAVESLQAAAPARIVVVIAAHNEAALLPFTLPPVLAQPDTKVTKRAKIAPFKRMWIDGYRAVICSASVLFCP